MPKLLDLVALITLAIVSVLVLYGRDLKNVFKKNEPSP